MENKKKEEGASACTVNFDGETAVRRPQRSARLREAPICRREPKGGGRGGQVKGQCVEVQGATFPMFPVKEISGVTLP